MRYLLSVTLMSFAILPTGCSDNSSTVPIGTFDAVVEGTISSSSGSAL